MRSPWKTACLAAAMTFARVANAVAAPGEIIIPTVYEAGHFFAVPMTSQGQALRLLVDTGGGGAHGMMLMTSRGAHMVAHDMTECAVFGRSTTVVKWPEFAPDRALSRPNSPTSCQAMAMVFPAKGPQIFGDGIMGGGYLPEFDAWHFDYLDRRLSIEAPNWVPPAAHPIIPLGFPKDTAGRHTGPFGTVEMTVDGQSFAMLLDTGATAQQTPAGQQATGQAQVNGEGTTSYITTSQMERWHARHPDWKIVNDGDGLFHTRLIKVPAVGFGPYTIGPIWFTERPDRNFGPEGIGQYMDRTIYGALGANILSHFDIVVDYRRSQLVILRGPI